MFTAGFQTNYGAKFNAQISIIQMMKKIHYLSVQTYKVIIINVIIKLLASSNKKHFPVTVFSVQDLVHAPLRFLKILMLQYDI